MPWQEKRATPTVTFVSGTTGVSLQHGGGGSTATCLSAAHLNSRSMHVEVTNSGAPFTVGYGCVFYLSLTSSYIEVDAEL